MSLPTVVSAAGTGSGPPTSRRPGSRNAAKKVTLLTNAESGAPPLFIGATQSVQMRGRHPSGPAYFFRSINGDGQPYQGNLRSLMEKWATGVAYERDKDKWRITRASLLVLECWRREYDVSSKLDTFRKRVCFVWYSWLRPMHKVAIFALLFLTWFEKPPWCYGPEEKCSWPTYPSFVNEGVYLERKVNALIELPLLAVLMLRPLFLKGMLGHEYWTKSWQEMGHHWLFHIALVVAIIDAIILATKETAAIRISWFARIVMYCVDSYRTRQVIILIVTRTIPKILPIMLLLVFYVMFSAAIAYGLFEHYESKSAIFFVDYGESVWSLVVLLTSVNYPDVLVPEYEASYGGTSGSLFFFIAYIVGGLWFLMPLTLGVVYNVYSTFMENLPFVRETEREKRLEQAFRELDPENTGMVPMAAIGAMLAEINICRVMRISTESIHELQKMEAANQEAQTNPPLSGCVTLPLFKAMMDKLDWHITHASVMTELEQNFPQFWVSPLVQRMEKFVCEPTITLPLYVGNVELKERIPAYDLFELLLAFATVTLLPMVLSSCKITANEAPGAPVCKPDLAQTSLLVAYAVDLFVKVILHGSVNYTRRLQYRFEGVVLIMFAIYFIYVAIRNLQWREYLHSAAVLRTLHILVLLKWIPQPPWAMAKLTLLAQRIIPILSVMFAWAYTMAILGITLFGGLVCNPYITNVPEKMVCASGVTDSPNTLAYGTQRYYGFNFNDLGSAFATVFSLLVVNNWSIFADYFTVVTGTKWARLYFVVNYFVGVILALNLAVSFIIRTFWESIQDTDRDISKLMKDRQGGTPDKSRETSPEDRPGASSDESLPPSPEGNITPGRRMVANGRTRPNSYGGSPTSIVSDGDETVDISDEWVHNNGENGPKRRKSERNGIGRERQQAPPVEPTPAHNGRRRSSHSGGASAIGFGSLDCKRPHRANSSAMIELGRRGRFQTDVSIIRRHDDDVDGTAAQLTGQALQELLSFRTSLFEPQH